MDINELLEKFFTNDKPSVCVDSREVKPGDIFVAVKGTAADGHDFIDQAVSNGARYIVCQDGVSYPDVETIKVEDSAYAAGVLAQAARGNPASKLTNLAVTGTNGKTTVAYLVRSIINNTAGKCGLVGTIVCDTVAKVYDSTLTTPDCISIAEMTAEMVEAGGKYMAIEASSHALDQKRLAGIDFRAAAFTNLSGDHLDYHKTEEDYLAAKTTLFEWLAPGSVAVLNRQSEHAEKIANKIKADICWYGIDVPADLIARIETKDISGMVFDLEYAGETERVTTPLVGRYNISNCLAAAGLCLAAGFDLKQVASGLSALKAVPGRLEKVGSQKDFTVLVDYAHTDDALKNVLSALKPLCKGRLIVVFGCGGDRDNSKRPRMAAVAEQLADIVIVTSDNPRSEQLEYIIGEIITGFENPVADNMYRDADREKAIAMAIEMARKDDIILIAGKGHETYQIIGSDRLDFDDRLVAAKYIEAKT